MKLKKVKVFIIFALCFAIVPFVTSIKSTATQNGNLNGFTPSIFQQLNSEKTNNSIKSAVKKRGLRDALPQKFDLRTDRPSWTDGARNQGSYGTCWTFASSASMESSLVRNGIISDLGGANSHDDTKYLSTKHIAYSAYNDYMFLANGGNTPSNLLNAGGNSSKVTAALKYGFGPVTENQFPYSTASTPIVSLSDLVKQDYQLYDETELPSPLESWSDETHPLSDYSQDTLTAIKNAIYKYGAVEIDFNASNTNKYYNQTYNAFYNYENNPNSANHAVTIVGYDDTFPKEKFTGSDATKMPPADGAFIIKNSWGTSGSMAADNGHFYLSYYDQTIYGEYVYSLKNVNNNIKTDFYDTLGNVGFELEPTTNHSLKFGNIFSVTDEKYNLNAISYFRAYDLNQKTTVSIYTDLSNLKDPESGTKKAEFLITPTNSDAMNGLNNYTGYHTYYLSDYAGISSIPLEKGTNYSIVVKNETKASENVPTVPIEINNAKYFNYGDDGGFSISRGQSFINVGNTYSDFVDTYNTIGGTGLYGNPNVQGILSLSDQVNPTESTVTFNSQGGSPTPASQNIPYGDNATEPDPPTKTGYSFLGWYTYSDNSTILANINDKFSFTDTSITDNITLYAGWYADTLTVTFNGNGGEPATQTKLISYSDKVAAPTVPTRTGYTFLGWYTDNGILFDFNSSILTDTVLYATWKVVIPKKPPEQKVYITKISVKKNTKKKIDFIVSIRGATAKKITIKFGKYSLGTYSIKKGHIIIKGKAKVKKFYKKLKKAVKKSHKKYRLKRKYRITFYVLSAHKSIKIKAII